MTLTPYLPTPPAYDAVRPPYAFRRESLAPSIIVPDDADERQRREAAAAIALACVGVDRDLDDEIALMAPHDNPREARDYLRGDRVSTCALFARGYLLLLGCAHVVLDTPYLPRRPYGQAVSDVVRVARDFGAWRSPDGSSVPAMGDVIVMGRMLPFGAPDPAWVRGTRNTEHVLVVTHVDGAELSSVDGGQPGVEPRSRELVFAGVNKRELWLAQKGAGLTADGRPRIGRRIVGWLDLLELPLERDAFVPVPEELPEAA